LTAVDMYSSQIFRELKINHPVVKSFSIQQIKIFSDSSYKSTWLSLIGLKATISESDKKKIENWLTVRTNISELTIRYEK